ncbi:MAG: glycosyltransferase [Clostridium sp.]|nr:glycosyltransferase [Clostridium sp.]
MQILWVGCLESDEEFKNKAKKGYNLASAQVSQQNLINGIEQVSGYIFDSINGSVLPPYPAYKDKIIEPVVWSHSDGAFDISVGYKNDKYFNRINCKISMLEAAKNWVKKRYQGGELKVLVYSMRSAPMDTACYIKRKVPKAKIYLIITDLPQFMDLGQSKLKAALKKVDWISIKRMQKKFDGFVLYAAKMAEFLNIPDGKWMLMEGSYNDKETIAKKPLSKKKAVMYSGKLDNQYGIPMLLDAFMEIGDSDVELWITGGGNAEVYVKECASRDERIKFYGFLPGRTDVLNLQQQASLLVNMRLPSELASAYCFPSKLLEYMATGVPVLSFKLKGIPEEYYPYLITVEHESKNDLRKSLEASLSLNAVDSLGMKARSFVVEQKNKESQGKRISAFVQI